MGSRPVKITPEDASSYPRNILKKPEAGPKLSQNERFWNHQQSQEQTVMKGKHFLVARPDPPLSWSLSFIHTHTHTHTHSHTHTHTHACMPMVGPFTLSFIQQVSNIHSLSGLGLETPALKQTDASSGADSTLLGKRSTWGRGRQDVPMSSEGDWGSGQVMTQVRDTTDRFHVQHFSSQE